VLFDMGSTLVHYDESRMYQQYVDGSLRAHEYIRSLGVPVPLYATFFRKVTRRLKLEKALKTLSRKEMDTPQLFGKAFRKMGFALTEAQSQKMTRIWFGPISEDAYVYPETVETVATIRRMGLATAIVSNTVVPSFLLLQDMERFGIIDQFDVKVFSSDLGVKKPHKRIFEQALSMLGVAPDEAVFVGDRIKEDIRGARRVGMTTVLVLNSEPVKLPRGRGPDYVIGHLGQLLDVIRSDLMSSTSSSSGSSSGSQAI